MNPHLFETRRPRARRRVRRSALSVLASRGVRDERDARVDAARDAFHVGPARILRCRRPRLEPCGAGLRLVASATVDPPGPLIGRLVVRAAVVDGDGTAMIGNRLPVDDVVAVLSATAVPGEYLVEAQWPAGGRLAGVLASGLGLTLSVGWDGRPDVSVGDTWYRDHEGDLRRMSRK